MSRAKGIKAVMGTTAFAGDGYWSESEDHVLAAFTELKKHGVNTLDSAQAYGISEQLLGKLKAGTEHGFIIDTKWRGGYSAPETPSTKENIEATAKLSLEKLQVEQVDIFYIHSPDYRVPFEDTLEGVNAVFKTGAFKRFGLSNFPPEDVQKVYDICKEKGYVLPTAYQGNYSAVARKQEETLFPVLRKLGMSFYAYSPIAGGFLTKTRQQIEGGGTRFSKDQVFGIYHALYVKDSYMNALETWEKIANEEGVSKAELAYRWVAFNSILKPEFGDALVLGASSLKQLVQTLGFFEKGPLSEKAVKGIQAIWESVEHEAGVDNFQATSARRY